MKKQSFFSHIKEVSLEYIGHDEAKSNRLPFHFKWKVFMLEHVQSQTVIKHIL